MSDIWTDQGTPPKRPGNLPEREWRPGDSLVLPPIDPLAYPENTPDPVRQATRQRIRAWMDGRKGCV